MNGLDVAGIMVDDPAMGVPPHWGPFVTVDDLDAVCAATEANGGTVFAPPFDVMEQGRMCVVADPTGAALSFWSPISHIGSSVRDEHGSLIWIELMSTDIEASTAFWTSVVGWDSHVNVMSEEYSYTLYKVDDDDVCGGGPAMEPGMPSVWGIYLGTDDADATAAKAVELGGSILNPNMDLPGVGRMGVIADSTGVVFSILQPEMPA